MCSMKLAVFVIVLLMNKYVSSCYHSTVTDREVCNSFDEVDAEGNDQWKNVIVQRGTGKPRIVLRENSFLRAPNLGELSVHALVKEIEPGSFKGLNKLDKLVIFDNDFKEISPDIFTGLNIRTLQLINNGQEVLPQNIFKEIPKVRVVSIDKNKIKVIPAGVFNGTSVLKLYLQDNGIETIENEAFFEMRSITVLNLSGNRLKTFETKLIFGNNPTITSIWLSRNQFTKISSNMLTTVPFMEQLFMEINQIDEIEDHAFEKVPQLEFLDVSNNLIEELEPKMATKDGLKRLGVLFLHNNRMTFINTVLLTKFPKLKYVTFGGNPFQCPCLTQLKHWLREKNITQLCDDLYYAGERPSCVISSVSSTSCIYDVDLHKDLYQLYMEALADYGSFNNMKCDTTNGFAAASLQKTR